jgi:hypothetical protein
MIIITPAKPIQPVHPVGADLSFDACVMDSLLRAYRAALAAASIILGDRAIVLVRIG